MAVDRAADVSRHALTQPGHGIEARGGRHGKHGGYAKKRQEVEINMFGAFHACRAKAQVDHLLERIRNRQRGTRRDQQCYAGQHKLPLVGGEERKQSPQGGQAAFFACFRLSESGEGRGAFGSRHCFFTGKCGDGPPIIVGQRAWCRSRSLGRKVTQRRPRQPHKRYNVGAYRGQSSPVRNITAKEIMRVSCSSFTAFSASTARASLAILNSRNVKSASGCRLHATLAFPTVTDSRLPPKSRQEK